MIFELNILLNTKPADQLQKYLRTKALKESTGYYICIIGKNHSYLKC